MPTEERMVQRISDWSNGPWGILGPFKGPEAGFLFDSIGMQPYTNGMLGPYFRPEIVHTYSSNPFRPDQYRGMVQIYDNFGVVSPTAAIAAFFNASATECLMINCTTGSGSIKGIDNPSSYAVQPVLPSDTGVPGRNNFIQYANRGAVHSSVGTVDAVFPGAGDILLGGISLPAPVSFDTSGIVAHRDRYWVWGNSTSQSRMYFSNPGTPLVYNALNFFDIGAAGSKAILGAWPLFDTLLIYMEDYTWWTLRYTDDPLLGELKFIGRHLIPDYHVSVGTDGSRLYFTGRDEGIVVITPEGIDRETFGHIRSGTWGAARRAVHVRQSNIMILPRFEGISFMQVNGNWWKIPGFGMKLYDAFEYGPTEYGLFGYSDAQGSAINTNKTWHVSRVKAEMNI
jgi:hypothetical protein